MSSTATDCTTASDHSPEQRVHTGYCLGESALPVGEIRDLPEPVGLRRMLGPSVLLLAVGLGSGEFILWPSVSVQYGYDLLWAACLGCATQFIVNMEIARYSMLTGETVTTGFARLHPLWPWVFLIANVVCWMWPGWASASSSCLVFLVGGKHIYYSIGGLVAAGLLLSLGPIIYRAAKVAQSILIVVSFGFILIVVAALATWQDLGELAQGLLKVGSIPAEINVGILVTAVAFAGAGGTLNLCHGHYLREQGYAMGKYVGRLASPITGQEEPICAIGFRFRCTPENNRRWRRWFSNANVEHAVTFLALGILSILLMCLISVSAVGHGRPQDGMQFISDVAGAIGQRVGAWGRAAYLLIGLGFLYTTCLGILDATSRLSADIVKVNWRPVRESTWWTQSKLYVAFLWLEIGLGITILLGGLSQPVLLLTVSGSLGIGVMCLYSLLLLYACCGRLLSKSVSMSWWRFAAMVWSVAFYGYFTLLTLRNLRW